MGTEPLVPLDPPVLESVLLSVLKLALDLLRMSFKNEGAIVQLRTLLEPEIEGEHTSKGAALYFVPGRRKRAHSSIGSSSQERAGWKVGGEGRSAGVVLFLAMMTIGLLNCDGKCRGGFSETRRESTENERVGRINERQKTYTILLNDAVQKSRPFYFQEHNAAARSYGTVRTTVRAYHI